MKKNEYPTVHLEQGQYYVYCHTVTTEDNQKLYYIGISQQQPALRWRPSQYKGTALQEYIERYGWSNIQHQVLAVVADKRSAETLEDQMIMALNMNGMVINSNRSGGHERDNQKEYNHERYEENKEEILKRQRKHYEEHKEEIRKQHRDYYEEHKETIIKRVSEYYAKCRAKAENKIYSRVKAYNRFHDPIETPLDAKQKYLETGYIPDYIKNDDLE